MKKFLVFGLALIMMGVSAVSYAAYTEEDLVAILTQVSQGEIEEDVALAQLQDLFDGEDFDALVPNIQEVFAMVTDALIGGGDLNAAIGAATGALAAILDDPNPIGPDNNNAGNGEIEGQNIVDAVDGAGKDGKEKTDKEKAAEEWAKEPTVKGTITGIETIDGKTYVAVKADQVDICDGNGFQEAEGETWMVEVDSELAKELEDNIGEEIVMSGDIQENVNGELSINLYTKEYLADTYGVTTDRDDFFALGDDIDAYLAEMEETGSWNEQLEEKMAPIYEQIEKEYGKDLTYKEKVEILKQMLLDDSPNAGLSDPALKHNYK